MPRRKRSQRQEEPVDKAAAGSGASADAAADDGGDELSKWICLTCTWRNAPDAEHCAMCEFSRPVDGDDYNCDICGVTCTACRYHKDDEDDIDLCPDCYKTSAKEIFVGAVFIRIEQSEPSKKHPTKKRKKEAAKQKRRQNSTAKSAPGTRKRNKRQVSQEDPADAQSAAAAAPPSAANAAIAAPPKGLAATRTRKRRASSGTGSDELSPSAAVQIIAETPAEDAGEDAEDPFMAEAIRLSMESAAAAVVESSAERESSGVKRCSSHKTFGGAQAEKGSGAPLSAGLVDAIPVDVHQEYEEDENEEEDDEEEDSGDDDGDEDYRANDHYGEDEDEEEIEGTGDDEDYRGKSSKGRRQRTSRHKSGGKAKPKSAVRGRSTKSVDPGSSASGSTKQPQTTKKSHKRVSAQQEQNDRDFFHYKQRELALSDNDNEIEDESNEELFEESTSLKRRKRKEQQEQEQEQVPQDNDQDSATSKEPIQQVDRSHTPGSECVAEKVPTGIRDGARMILLAGLRKGLADDLRTLRKTRGLDVNDDPEESLASGSVLDRAAALATKSIEITAYSLTPAVDPRSATYRRMVRSAAMAIGTCGAKHLRRALLEPGVLEPTEFIAMVDKTNGTNDTKSRPPYDPATLEERLAQMVRDRSKGQHPELVAELTMLRTTEVSTGLQDTYVDKIDTSNNENEDEDEDEDEDDDDDDEEEARAIRMSMSGQPEIAKAARLTTGDNNAVVQTMPPADANERVVKGIVNVREVNDTKQYKVRYKGCGKDEDEWLPADSVSQVHKDEFWQRKKKLNLDHKNKSNGVEEVMESPEKLAGNLDADAPERPATGGNGVGAAPATPADVHEHDRPAGGFIRSTADSDEDDGDQCGTTTATPQLHTGVIDEHKERDSNESHMSKIKSTLGTENSIATQRNADGSSDSDDDDDDHVFPQRWREQSALDAPSTNAPRDGEDKVHHHEHQQLKTTAQAATEPMTTGAAVPACDDQSSSDGGRKASVVERKENCDCPEPVVCCSCARVNPKMRGIGRVMLSKILASSGKNFQMPIVKNADGVAKELEQALHSAAAYHPQGIMYREKLKAMASAVKPEGPTCGRLRQILSDQAVPLAALIALVDTGDLGNIGLLEQLVSQYCTS